MAAPGDISMGTTILAFTYDGGIVLGADTRTSNGAYIANRTQDKITPLSDRVFALRSGSASDTQAVASYVQYFIAQAQAERDEELTVKTVAHLAMGITYENKDALSAGLIVGGWDKVAGGTIWEIPMGGTLMQVPYATGGSGSAYIYGFCDKFWKAGMTEAEAKEFTIRAVAHAVARDASSGGCIRTMIVDKNGARRDFLDGSNIPQVYGEMLPPAAAAAAAAAAGGQGVALAVQ